jgi:hypothetical protein
MRGRGPFSGFRRALVALSRASSGSPLLMVLLTNPPAAAATKNKGTWGKGYGVSVSQIAGARRAAAGRRSSACPQGPFPAGRRVSGLLLL